MNEFELAGFYKEQAEELMNIARECAKEHRMSVEEACSRLCSMVADNVECLKEVGL